MRKGQTRRERPYALEAARDIQRLEQVVPSRESKLAVRMLCRALTVAPRVRLPNGGRLVNLAEVPPEELPMLRLPYATMCLEYPMVGPWGAVLREDAAPSPKRIAVVHDTDAPGAFVPRWLPVTKAFLVQSVFVLEMEGGQWVWTVHPWAAAIPKRQSREEVRRVAEDAAAWLSEEQRRLFATMASTHPIEAVRRRVSEGHWFEDVCWDPVAVIAELAGAFPSHEAILGDLMEELWAAMDFLVAVSCPGARVEKGRGGYHEVRWKAAGARSFS